MQCQLPGTSPEACGPCDGARATGSPLKTALALTQERHLGKVIGVDAKGEQTEEKSLFDLTAQERKRKEANYFLLRPKPGPDKCFDALSNMCPT